MSDVPQITEEERDITLGVVDKVASALPGPAGVAVKLLAWGLGELIKLGRLEVINVSATDSHRMDVGR